MKWNRPQEAVVLIGAAAVFAASGVLLAARRPAPAIRVIEAPPASDIAVQVDGAVVRPGVYRLPQGARVGDALDAAGGPAGGADVGALNRARRLRDGERVSVPAREATAVTGLGALDLNAADAAALESLPGIGRVLARRIIEYRSHHGPFQRLEDLLQVQGVGPRLLDGLRPHVVVR